MSIETEFESTITNVKNAYQGLDNLGATIPQNKTIENIKSCLDEIYNNLPKTAYSEGSNITLSNTLKGKLDFEDGIVGYGQTEQKSYEGYQLIPYTLATLKAINTVGTWNNNVYTYNGITYTIEEENGYIKQIKTTGTATSNSILALISTLDISAGTYYLSGCPNGGSVSTYFIYSGPGLAHNVSETPTTITFNEDTSLSSNNMRITILSGTSLSNLIWKPMLSKTNTTDFEPYVGGTASPSPSYPQDIEVVRGTQTVYIKDENNNIIDTKTINLGEYEFAKIGNYVDTIEYDVENDKVYKNEKIHRYEFTGQENFSKSGEYGGGYSFFLMWSNTLLGGVENAPFKCNMGSYVSAVADYGIGKVFSDRGMAMNLYSTTEVVTDDDFKAKLKDLYDNGTPCYIVHQKATPELIEITDTTLRNQVKALYNAHSLNGTTIIEIDGQLPLIIKVRALKGE